jgi:hypothetical protein
MLVVPFSLVGRRSVRPDHCTDLIDCGIGRRPDLHAHVVPAGSGFVDQGHDVHVVRNEGSVDLVTVVVSLVPAGFGRRIDEPSPGNCPF